jgi:hypothetical protein
MLKEDSISPLTSQDSGGAYVGMSADGSWVVKFHKHKFKLFGAAGMSALVMAVLTVYMSGK